MNFKRKKSTIYNIIYALIAILACLFFFILPKHNLVFLSPDEKSIFELSKEIKNDFKLQIHDDESLSTRIKEAVTLRDSANIDGVVVPQTFLGYLYVLGVTNLISGSIQFLYMFIGFYICLVYIYKLNTLIWNKKIGLISLFFGLTSVLLYFFYLGTIRSELIYVGLLIMGLYYLLKSEGQNKKFIYLSVLLFSLSISFRYINIAFVGLLALGWAVIYKPKNLYRLIFGAIIIFIPFVSQILLLNQSIYGKRSNTGYAITGEKFTNILNEDKSLTEYDIEVLWNHVYVYLLDYKIYITILALLGLIHTIHRGNINNKKKTVLLALSILFILLLYYGGKEIRGNEKIRLNSSFLRYNALFLLLLHGFAISKFSKHQWLIIPFVLVFNIQLSQNFDESYGSNIPQNNEGYQNVIDIKDWCINNTNGGYIYTFINDKTFYPCMKPIVQLYLIQEHKEIGVINEYTRKNRLKKSMFLDTYKELYSNTDEDIYITSEVYGYNVLLLGLELEKVIEFEGGMRLYKILGLQ